MIMARMVMHYLLCLLVLAAITVAFIVSTNVASKARFERKIQTLAAHDEARSRYSIHPRFIFDEIDFRNDQSEKKRAALAEFHHSFIDTDRALGFLKIAALLLAAAFAANYIVRWRAVRRRKSSASLERIRIAELASRGRKKSRVDDIKSIR